MIFIAVIAVVTLICLRNRQENRAIDRRNRIAEKQEELIERLKKQNETENKDNDN